MNGARAALVVRIQWPFGAESQIPNRLGRGEGRVSLPVGAACDPERPCQPCSKDDEEEPLAWIAADSGSRVLKET